MKESEMKKIGHVVGANTGSVEKIGRADSYVVDVLVQSDFFRDVDEYSLCEIGDDVAYKIFPKKNGVDLSIFAVGWIVSFSPHGEFFVPPYFRKSVLCKVEFGHKYSIDSGYIEDFITDEQLPGAFQPIYLLPAGYEKK